MIDLTRAYIMPKAQREFEELFTDKNLRRVLREATLIISSTREAVYEAKAAGVRFVYSPQTRSIVKVYQISGGGPIL